MMELGQFFLEYGPAGLKPTVDLRQNVAKREAVQTLGQARQNTHNDAAPFRTTLGLAGSCRLAGHRFGAGLAFAAVIGRLDFRVQDEYEKVATSGSRQVAQFRMVGKRLL